MSHACRVVLYTQQNASTWLNKDDDAFTATRRSAILEHTQKQVNALEAIPAISKPKAMLGELVEAYRAQLTLFESEMLDALQYDEKTNSFYLPRARRKTARAMPPPPSPPLPPPSC